LKKKTKQNITILVVVAAIITAIVSYNYSAEQTKQKGFNFGNELEQIQTEVKDLQTEFYSKKAQWEERTITEEELFQHYEKHVEKFEEIISKYDNLKAPESFQGAVELLKLSSQTQLDSDIQYIEWMKTGDESFKIRSDSQYQQSLEYEMLGLVEYYSAKTGIEP
jgi:HPt (histidine-containing phosphotransfer) domain-containing protein